MLRYKCRGLFHDYHFSNNSNVSQNWTVPNEVALIASIIWNFSVLGERSCHIWIHFIAPRRKGLLFRCSYGKLWSFYGPTARRNIRSQYQTTHVRRFSNELVTTLSRIFLHVFVLSRTCSLTVSVMYMYSFLVAVFINTMQIADYMLQNAFIMISIGVRILKLFNKSDVVHNPPWMTPIFLLIKSLVNKNVSVEPSRWIPHSRGIKSQVVVTIQKSANCFLKYISVDFLTVDTYSMKHSSFQNALMMLHFWVCFTHHFHSPCISDGVTQFRKII